MRATQAFTFGARIHPKNLTIFGEPRKRKNKHLVTNYAQGVLLNAKSPLSLVCSFSHKIIRFYGYPIKNGTPLGVPRQKRS